MAKQIVWSQRAQQDRKIILHYWIRRNKSNVYSKKLNLLFKHAIKIIAEFPKIGRLTDDKSLRAKVVRDYLIFYEESETQIQILTIWDTRRDPGRLEEILKKP